MKKRDKVDKIIKNVLYEFTHLWIDGFGWENTILLASDFDKVLKMPIKDANGNELFMAYNLDEKNQKVGVQKFKGAYHGRVN